MCGLRPPTGLRPSPLRPQAPRPRHRLWAASFARSRSLIPTTSAAAAISSADPRTFDYRPIVFSVQRYGCARHTLAKFAPGGPRARGHSARLTIRQHLPQALRNQPPKLRGSIKFRPSPTALISDCSGLLLESADRQHGLHARQRCCMAFRQTCASVHLPLESSFGMLDIKLKLSWCWPELAVIFLFPSYSG